MNENELKQIAIILAAGFVVMTALFLIEVNSSNTYHTAFNTYQTALNYDNQQLTLAKTKLLQFASGTFTIETLTNFTANGFQYQSYNFVRWPARNNTCVTVIGYGNTPVGQYQCGILAAKFILPGMNLTNQTR